jgi:hypothetical protein
VRTGLSPIDIAARKHPLAIAGFNRTFDEDDSPATGADDGADGNLRIDVEDESAPDAHEPIGLVRLQRALFEAMSAPRAISIGVRLVVGV